MTMLRYNIQTGANGSVLIPTTPFADGAEIEVVLQERYRESQTLEDDWQTPTEKQRKAMERSKFAHRTPEEREAAFEDFMTSWEGCLQGVPHMTAKEIRAERLEKKYGQYNKEGNE